MTTTAVVHHPTRIVAVIACVLACGTLTAQPLRAQTDPTGTWRVDGNGPNLPWTLILRADGTTLTGVVRNCASNRGESSLFDGAVNGATVSFKCTSDDGNRTLTLRGVLNGESIEFTWTKEVKPGASPNPRDGMFGSTAPARFTAKRISESIRPDPTPASLALQQLLDARDYRELARSLPQVVGLRPEERSYFRGMLAFGEGRFDAAVQPLQSAVNTPDYSLTSYQAEQALETLGDTATKTCRYSDAVKMYDIVDRIFGARMGGAVIPVREKRAIAAAFEDTPPQTIQLNGDFTLTRTGIQYPIRINGMEFFALLDTGAAISMISESTAAKWGAKRLDGAVTLHGIGSGRFDARPALVPVLQLGQAEFRNVAVVVIDDTNMILAGAVLGYPVVSALGRVTVGPDQTLTVLSSPPRAAAGNDSPLWVSYSSLLMGVNTAPGGAMMRPFMLDTGSLSTFLTNRFLAEHRTEFPGKPPDEARLAGADGVHLIPAYSANRLRLWFGSRMIPLSGQHILAEARGGEVDKYFGVIGQDVLQQLAGYTIDFRSMRFSTP